MKLPEICIRQPVLALVLTLILVVVGCMSFLRLGLRFFPELNIPLMNVVVTFPGADPSLIENSITTPLENAIASVPGIVAINSSSSPSTSSIGIRFRMDTDFDRAVNAVRDKIAAQRSQIPASATPPNISVGGQGQPILNIDFTDSTKNPAGIRDYVDGYVSPRLQQIPGLGGVGVFGANPYAMRIWLNASNMAALGITVPDIEAVLLANNINFPAGSVQGPSRTYTIVSGTALVTPDQFADIVIKKTDARLLRFKDIANVKLGYLSLQNNPLRLNGQAAVDVAIAPSLSASPLDLAKRVKEMLTHVLQKLPPGMHAVVSYDGSLFLQRAINETFRAIAEAVILVVLVVFLFLGSVRASLVPVVTIPVCIVAVFTAIYLFGFTVNIMTLLAIVLAIGLVVDDAIVMLENIHRHIEEGKTPLQAAIVGSREIASPIIAMTLTLAAVYAPIGFAQGFSAEIFKEFAFTLASAVIISGFVALTLSPMMCAHLLKTRRHDPPFVVYLDQLFERLSTHYQQFLTFCLDQRRWVVIGVLLTGVCGYLIYNSLSSEFVPTEDVGLINIAVTPPDNASLDYVDQYIKKIEHLLKNNADIKHCVSFISPSPSDKSILLVLKPWEIRHETTQALVITINQQLKKIIGVNAVASIPDPVQYGMGGHDYAIHLMTPGSYNALESPMAVLTASLKKYPGLTQVARDLKYTSQQYRITVNRDLAASLGINIQDIATTLGVMVGGAHVTDIYAGKRSYEVKLQMPKEDLEDFSGINKLYVRSVSGAMIPLSTLITLTPSVGQPSLGHYNRMRAGTITAQIAPGYSISNAVDYTNKTLGAILTPEISYAYDGKAEQYVESQAGMTGIFVMAFIFIYLVLSAQFGSFIDPLIILLAVPLSMVGALLALKLSGGTLNLYSEIGLVTLVGLVSKHGILITQFANSLRVEGVALREAIVQAASIRLRPILMTTCAMVFGALPLAFAMGPGSVGREQIGWVIVGGLLIGTVFSLVIVPVAYSYLSRKK